MNRPQALATLERWKTVRGFRVPYDLLDAIVAVLNSGATWAEVGERLGMAAPNAHRKFGRYLESVTTLKVPVTTYRIKDPGKCTHRVPPDAACYECAKADPQLPPGPAR